MPISGDERQISLEEVVSAAVTHELAILVDRLTRERAWSSLAVVFGYAAGARAAATVDEVRAAAEALRAALRRIPAPRRPGAALADQMRAARIAAGEALLGRLSHPPLGDLERRALRTAAEMLSEASDHRRAAVAYEELGDNPRAADAYGAMGDLEQMESSLDREDARLRAEREALDELRSFESLMAAGERRAALAAAARIPSELPSAAGVRLRARDVEGRLVRERAITLRSARGGTDLSGALRFAGVPANLGRDLLAEVPVRDPSVSRRHAIIVARDGELMLQDAGSRAGVRVAGAALGAALPLRGEGEFALGRDCRIHFQSTAPGRVILRGASGLDRQLVATVGLDPLPLEELIPGAEGTWLELAGAAPRLGRSSEVPVRVGGNYVGSACDLLHGDVIEIRPSAPGAATPPPPALRIEVD
ncbi:MAG TPA: FHA domain-containing protein [Polyangia bacterium]|nr:FHA domain-containing protein [Polyangia bacterium]